MVIIVQEPEILVDHRIGHNIDDPFAIVVYKGITARLDANITLLEESLGSGNVAFAYIIFSEVI